MGFVILFFGGALILAVLVAVLNTADFTIRLGGGGVRVKGRIPSKLRAEIVDFFEREFPQDRRATIRGSQSSDGRLNLRFRGHLPQADRQRIRNFLVLTLCR